MDKEGAPTLWNTIQPLQRMQFYHLKEKWSQLKIVMLSKISQSQKDKDHKFFLTYSNLHTKYKMGSKKIYISS